MEPTARLSTNFFASLNTRIVELAAQGADIIRLDIGSPDLPPASHIIEALSQAAARPDTHGYQPHAGKAKNRAAWIGMYKRVFGVSLAQKNVLPLLGSKEGIFHLSQALLNPGDVVLIPDPGYMTYMQSALFANAQPCRMPLLPENDYQPDFSRIPAKISQRAKMMWLNYPNNPTAATASLEFFARAVEYCRKYEVLLCQDAAYTQVTFDGYRAPSILEIPGAVEVAVEFNSLSKSHNMAGWRTGAVLGNPEAIAALLKLKTHIDSGHFLPIIEAATAALTGDQNWLHERNRVYQERRNFLVPSLHKIGFAPRTPQATIYVWSPVPEGWSSSEDFVHFLLEKAHVSLTPGTIFGPGGEGFVRISLGRKLEDIEKALERLQNIMEIL